MKYNYAELKEKAINGTEGDVNNLGEWFENYGLKFWNGEFYDADGLRLYPIFEDVGQDEFEPVGYELKI